MHQSEVYSLKLNYSAQSPMSQTTLLILYLIKSLPIGQLLSEGSGEPQESLRSVPGGPQQNEIWLNSSLKSQ